MKIALLHDTFWPAIGGVEQVMRDQAGMLQTAGHAVTVFAGHGADPGDGYAVQILPELAPDFPLHAQVRAVLERGQTDQNFSRYRAALVAALRSALGAADLTLVHNLFTMHHNLALTLALHDLAPEHRMIAWTHDLVAGNPDYALPNPTQPPWNLMRTANPQVAYVAISELRAEEIKAQLKPAVIPLVVPDMIDRARLFGLSAEMRASCPSLDLAARDFVFLLPAPLVPRKNIDFALQIIGQLREMGRDPLLLITAAPAPGPASAAYGDFLRQTLAPELRRHVVFISDFFPVRDDILRDLYLLADCLLYPSAREGFGLPIVEAAACRLPIWCQDVPAFQALAGDGAAYPLEDLSRLAGAVEWLESLPTFRQQRRCRQTFDPGVIYHRYYEPLLGSAAPAPG
jgi:glycosyltransferase involved in cell wall biosynthesis